LNSNIIYLNMELEYTQYYPGCNVIFVTHPKQYLVTLIKDALISNIGYLVDISKELR